MPTMPRMRALTLKPTPRAPSSANGSGLPGAESGSLPKSSKKTRLSKIPQRRHTDGKEGEKVVNKSVDNGQSKDGATSKSQEKSSREKQGLKHGTKPSRKQTTGGKGSIEEGGLVERDASKAKKKKNVGAVDAEDGKGETRAKRATGKMTNTGKKPAVLNRFSLKADEQRASTKNKKKNTYKKMGSNDRASASGGQSAVDRIKEGSMDGKEEEDTPDIRFHKRMTKEKLSLLARSPLSRLLSQKEKDAAAQEMYGKGVKFAVQGKRKMDDNEVDEVIPLDATQPPKKKSRTTEAGTESLDPVQLAARRKENRKLKRKVRQMRARGELPDEEKEAPEVGVVYLGHIPHGFYENEMRGYFSQFGEVTRLRLSRSKKTARSRGFAFIEFADVEVATKAAESMDGYLMHGQKLVAKLVPPEKIHPDTFKGANRVFKKIPFSAIERRAMIHRSRDPMKLAQRSRGVQKKLQGKKEKLAQMGIKYEFPEISSNIES